MKEVFLNIEDSFKRIMRGEEHLKKVIWSWGLFAYIISFFIFDRFVRVVDYRSFDIVISLLTVSYFIWHIYALVKCNPKKPKLTQEEKKQLKLKAKMERGKKFLRKLFLQEPLTQTNPAVVCGAVDLFFIAHFGNYIF